MKANAIVVNQIGGPEVLQFSGVEVPAPGPGEVLLRHRAIGLNFVEIYFRSGVYPAPSMPFTPGSEAAGVVEAIGPGVSELKPGRSRRLRRRSMGAYAEARVIPARFLVKLPDSIDEATAAAAMLKGMTAHDLIFSVYAVKPGDTILVQAAAGGVGLILCQWAKHLGATVIGCRRQRREGAPCGRSRMRPHDRLHARGYRGAGQGNHRRRDGSGGLRFGRAGDLHEVDRLSASARPDGRLRAGVRHRAAVQRQHPQRQGLALSDPARRCKPTPPSARNWSNARRRFSRRSPAASSSAQVQRRFALRDAADGSSRVGRTQYHRIERADALIVAAIPAIRNAGASDRCEPSKRRISPEALRSATVRAAAFVSVRWQ